MPFLRNPLLAIAGFIAAATSTLLVYGHSLRGQVLTAPSFRGQGYGTNYLHQNLSGGPLSPPPFVGIPRSGTVPEIPSAPAPFRTDGQTDAAFAAPIPDTSNRVEELSRRYGTAPEEILSALEETDLHPQDLRDVAAIQTSLQNAGYQSFQDIPQILLDLNDTHKALDTLQMEHAQTMTERQRLSEENHLFQNQVPRTGLGRTLQNVGDTVGGVFGAIGRFFGRIF